MLHILEIMNFSQIPPDVSAALVDVSCDRLSLLGWQSIELIEQLFHRTVLNLECLNTINSF